MILAFVILVFALRFVSLGGGLYEIGLVDRVWPQHPDLIRPSMGGISRARFWIPAHLAYEIALIIALVIAWPHAAVRLWLIVAVTAQVVMRFWSVLHFIPLALRFERGDPQLGTGEAQAWVRGSRWRLLIDGGGAAAIVAALIEEARL